MRQDSANSIKRKQPGRTLQRLPREGTHLRVLYDRFMANKGRPVVIEKRDQISSIPQLVDFYGLDIRAVHPPGGRKGRPRKAWGGSIYILAGEWFGKVYVDYIADIINKGGK